MKLTHKQKVKLARKMRSRLETKERVGLFLSKEWTNRNEARKIKELGRMKLS